MRLEPQPLRFERQGAAAGERVVKRGERVPVEQLRGARMIGVLGARPPPTLPDLRARPPQHVLVGRVLPLDQLFENPEQALSLLLGHDLPQRPPISSHARFHLVPCPAAFPEQPLRCALLLRVGQEYVDVPRGVVDHLSEEHGPRCGERAARPPEVKRARMPMADGFLAGRRPVDGVER